MDTEFFYKASGRPDQLHPWCKACYTEHRYPNGRGLTEVRMTSPWELIVGSVV